MQVEQVEEHGRGSPLGILTKFASRVEIIEDFKKQAVGQEAKQGDRKTPPSVFRHFLAMRQRQVLNAHKAFSSFKTLMKCGALPIPSEGRRKDGESYGTGAPGVVQAVAQEVEEGRLSFSGFAWVRKCANPLLCFCCAPKIHYKRGQEVELISNIMYDYDYRWLFVTFTCRHDWDADPVRQVDLFQEAQRKMRAGRKFQAWKERWGYEHQIRSIEMTDDSPAVKYKTGCHFHNHVIMFFKHEDFTEKDCQQCRDELSEMWLDALQKVGLWDGVTKKDFMKVRAVVAKCPRKNKDKQGIDAARYAAKGASCELTPGIFTKFGRLPARISHWEVMALAFTKRPDMIPRALKIMDALKGRSWLQFSRGLKDFCGIEDKTDDDLMKEDMQVVVYEYEDQKLWKSIDRYKQQAAIRQAIEEYEKNGGENLADACDYYSGLVAAGLDPLQESERLKDTQTVDAFISNPILNRYEELDPMTGFPVGATFPPGSISGRLFAGFKRRRSGDEIECSAAMSSPFFGMTDEDFFYAQAVP